MSAIDWTAKRPALMSVTVKTEGTGEMKRRLDVIRILYDRQCERSQIERWNHWALQVAKRIGKGEQITDCFLASMVEPVTVAGVAAQRRAWGIPARQVTSTNTGCRSAKRRWKPSLRRSCRSALPSFDLRGEPLSIKRSTCGCCGESRGETDADGRIGGGVFGRGRRMTWASQHRVTSMAVFERTARLD